MVTNNKQLTASILFLLALGSIGPAIGADIYKWIDESGKVNVSDNVPEKYRDRARSINVRAAEPNATQQADAQARAEKEKQLAETSVKARQAGSTQLTSPVNSTSGSSSCERRQREYRASLDCFAPYVTKGGIHGDAAKHCQAVVDPTPDCGVPVDRTSSNR